jgi:signal recognition particle subunit SRP54
MLETLTQGFTAARERLSGVRELAEDNVAEALRDVRMSLLEADVDLSVVRDFLDRVKERALGEKVDTRVRDALGRMVKVTPGQHFVKACHDELIALMGPVDADLAKERGVTSIMLVGLQGVGKTTVAGKLARHLQKNGRRPLLVAADVYRPAAVQQLQTLGAQLGVPVHAGADGDAPAAICAAGLARARASGLDAIVYDTAGRLAIDDELMRELDQIVAATSPANTLLVCDALMGRDAVTVAKGFADRLALDGLVLTKLDGDARGGAALAVKAVTGVPIKFLGTGETLERLEEFRPEGLASRILGMGDIVGLVKDFEEHVDEREAERDAARLLKGQFGLDDLLKQLKMVQKLGPLRDVIAKLPMFGSLADQVEESQLVRVESLIRSMTPDERRQPDLIDKSRARRIARGSGRRSSDVRELVERFEQMRELMSGLGSPGGLLGKIPGIGRLAGAGAGAGLGGLDPSALLGGAAGEPRKSLAKRRSQQRDKRKQARKSRKKNRRR